MKKIYSFMLIVLTLFSCVFFSACGDKYGNLRINIYSGDGSLIEEARFIIDDINNVESEKLTLQFSNIDEDDVGQILVYSIPNNLISVTNYKYNGNKCSVDITPEMSSNNAKLIVSHLASGKKKQIPLTIDQKSTSADFIKDGSYPRNKYIVSIPQVETAEHYVDLTSAFELKPSGSTDKIFFKLDSSYVIRKDNSIEGFDGVKLIPADIEGFEDVFVGFETASSVAQTANENSSLKIYPVTFLEDYNIEQQIEKQDQYENKTISVYFKKILEQENVVLSPQTPMDLNNIQLIANDEILNSFKLTLKNKYMTESSLVESAIFDKTAENSFFDMYELQFFSADETKVSAFADANNDVIVSALSYTEQPVEINILLQPINFVGDIHAIELTVKVKGELKSEKITVSKNGEEISTTDINIFDYYETGTSLGSLFEFNSGENIHSDINKMRIYVKPSILAEQNVSGKLPADVQVNNMLYSLMFSLVDDYLKFTYNGNLGMMVSAEIDSSTKVYIKYIAGKGKTESLEFGASVQTTNRSSIKHWDKLESAEVYLDFTPLKGVKTMELQAGYYHVKEEKGYHTIYPGANNIENIYLNRLEGLDNLNEDVYTNFIYVADTIKGFDDQLIESDQLVEFEVSVESLNEVTNPLKLYKRETLKDDGENNIEGVSSLTYQYSKNTTNDVIGLVYRSNTSLGDYKIIFKQEQVVKATLICRVYENLTELKTEYISIETNKQAFENKDYPEYQADYIVASGEKLDLSINLPKAVLDSGLIEGYEFTFKVGVKDGEEFTEAEIEVTDYFDVSGNVNLAELNFIKGTFLDGKPQYVYFAIKVITNIHETIVSEATLADPAPSIEFSFFIYEKIQEEDLSINNTSVVRYPEKYLAIDYKHLSKLNLEVDMNDELWGYTTGSVDVVWSIDGNILEFNYDLDGDGENDCYIESGVIVETAFGLNNCEFKFNTITGVDDYIKVIKAHIKQFYKIFEFQCVVYVEKPIITERLVIESETYTTAQSQNPFINLKVGEQYQVLARNLSGLGDVTNPEIVVQVIDEYGSAYNAKKYFEVNQTTSEITVKTIDNVNKFKLVVFAKDAIKESISQDKSGYNVPSNFLLEDYANAYFVIDIYLSDGSESNPYLIKSSYDFWEINEHELFKKAHYQLMTNISLDDVNDTQIIKTIDGFTGSISTYNNEIYTIDGIYLDKDMKNLFTNFGGKISNIKFSVNYAYNIDENVDQYLGLIDKNNGDGKLTNVGVYVRGYADLNGTATYYFGGLVGENSATIQYKDGHEDINSNDIIDEDEIVWVGIVGVDGLIELTGNATVYFGGLVGKNISSIVGCESTITTGGENEIILNVAGGRENSLSQISINAEIAGESAIGGVVGLNTYKTNVGTVHNAYVQAIIDAEKTSNVGGVIGKNIQNKNGLAVSSTNNGVVVETNTLSTVDNDYKTQAIYNVKSASRIKALNNVGGIVGIDTNGIYLECDYQILTATYKEIAIVANNSVGGIAGSSNSGIFVFCSVMSYNWNYSNIKEINDVADISATDYVGGIVGSAQSSTNDASNPFNGGDVDNKVVVVSSSVNAYLKSTVDIGGILSSNVGNAILYNVYFMGKLEGSIVYSEATLASKQYFALDNDGSSHFNAAYSLNVETSGGVTSLKTGSILNNRDFIINSATNVNYWWWNANINGGYLFITKDESGTDSSAPIFDLAPDEIDVTVNKEQPEGLERVLMLDYYDFSIAENATDAMLLELVELKNRSDYIYKLDRDGNNVGLLNIVAKPSSLGAVVINVKSTNSNIIDITYDGRILINGVGECELIFSSVLNPNAGNVSNRTIKVVVDYPKTDLHLSTSRTDKSKYVENDTQNIGKGSSKQYYAVTNGEFEYHKSVYQYKTKTDFNFLVEVGYETADTEFKIVDYLAITGTKAKSSDNQYIVDIDDKTPFMISVLQMLESGKFDVKVSPYLIVNGVKVYEDAVEFTISTLKGLTNVSFGYDEAVVYPNDIVYLNTYLSTDHKLTQDEIFNLIDIDSYDENYSYELYKYKQYIIDNNLDIRYIITKGKNTDNEIEVGSFILYINDSLDVVDDVQKVQLRIEFSDLNLEKEIFMQLLFKLGSGVNDGVDYTILPQRINKIDIRNYYYRNAEEGKLELVQQDVLKPNSAGEMIIDIVPDNGYYDYLEISDITGNEEIVFIQVDEQGNVLSLKHDPSSDGKGIKLYDYDLGKSRIYIRTQISNTYTSKIHTIEVRAYSSNDVLLASSRKYIDVKMLPEIQVTYLRPDGSDGLVAGNADGMNVNPPAIYLANGVDSTLRIETKNANTEIETSITAEVWSSQYNKYVEDTAFASNYELIKISDNLYTLDSKVYNATNVGKKLKLSFKVYSLLDNGDYDIAQCSVEFIISSFVIHGVSVNSSIDNATSSEIYGYYNREIDLNFYFDEDDISFYDETSQGEYFHDTVYEYDKTYKNNYNSETVIYQIQSILHGLNSFEDNGINSYLVLNNNERDNLDSTKYKEVDVTNITLKNNKLTVTENYTPDYLAVMFMLNYDSETLKWTITNHDGTKSDDGHYVVDKNYYLNFRKSTTWNDPTVINSVEDFKAMTSGESYILNVDLTGENALTGFTPIDADIIEFDGNGHTIEIKSFAQFNDVSIKAGLFAQIYPNMIVKNVKVKYVSTNEDGNYTFGNVDKTDKGIEYFDICNNPSVAYTDAQFGGIAAVNNGVITNCFVEGRVAVNASTLENKTISTGGNYEINFNIGGLVAENSSTGYITNSASELNIFAQANIGGFVYNNAGMIVSCGVEENTTIYGYNEKLGNTIIVDIAGFAVENSGKISMSYVNLVKKSTVLEVVDDVSIHEGTMSAKDFSAGFVVSNSGRIYDAYVQISETGVNNNRFAGFVDTNNGEITRAYTFINSGVQASKDDVMFVGENSGTLNNCIQFVAQSNNSKVEGLNSVDISSRNDKSTYEQFSFAFGDNISAVWTIQAGMLPKLVSTQELSFEEFKPLSINPVDDETDDGIDEVKYEVDPANYGTKQNPFIIHNIESWNYYFKTTNNVKMTGYYRIVKDIDFTSVGNNPHTTNVTFSGNIQGNNMTLSGIMLYSTSTLNSLGLFEKLEGVSDKHIENAVRNLTLNATSVWASSTNAVGVLAGVVENFNLYNIKIDAEGVIIVGRNAVGGVAGIIRGEFDMDQISSNVGVNSTRASTLYNYSIYMSKNNGSEVSYNLDEVYYAGSIAGILDGYDRTNYDVNNNRNIDRNYNKVQNVNVDGDLYLSGDTIGSAFGLVGEQVYVNRLNVNISGLLSGSQYSAGAVGENRGAVKNVTITLADEIFKRSKYVSAGAVGFNLGGLVDQVEVTANIIKNEYSQTSGGVVGRNVNGVISNAHFDGEITSYIAGGIVGSNYDYEMLVAATTGTGAIHGECKQNSNLIPKTQVEYYQNGNTIENYKNVSISMNAFKKIIENSTSFYSYKNNETTENKTLQSIIVKSKVIGLVAGLSYDKSIVDKTDKNTIQTSDDSTDDTYNIHVDGEKITFNSHSIAGVEYKEVVPDVILKDEVLDVDDVKFNFTKVNVLDIDVSQAYVIYLIGASTNSFDSWSNYSEYEYLLVK